MKLKDLFSEINMYEKRLYKPYVIAEAGVNHEGSMELAKRLCDEAKEGGADAIKLQTYTPDTITLDVYTNEFFINNENSLWKGQSLYDLYKQAYTPWEWHKEIFDYAKVLAPLFE